MDYGDLKGITTEEDTSKEVYAAVICEGCGFTTVDHTGRCICHTRKEHEELALGKDVS